MMGIWIKSLAAIGILATNCASDAAKPEPTYPREVRGIWFTDDADGQKSCKAYLAAYKRLDGTSRNYLVGAEVVSSNMWHSYAEYGEGNFYKIQRLAVLGPGSWRVDSSVGIDGAPEPGDAQIAAFRIGLKQGKLSRTFEGAGKNPQAGRPKVSFFLCMHLPKQ